MAAGVVVLSVAKAEMARSTVDMNNTQIMFFDFIS